MHGVTPVVNSEEVPLVSTMINDVNKLLESIRLQNSLCDSGYDRSTNEKLMTFIMDASINNHVDVVDYLLSVWDPALYTSYNNVAVIRSSYSFRHLLPHWFSTLCKLRQHHSDRPSLFIGLPLTEISTMSTILK